MALMRPMFDIQNQMERMINELTQGFGFPSGEFGTRVTPAVRTGWVPAIELTENDNEYTLCAEVPGLKPEDINVEVSQDSVVISGETREEKREERKNVHRSELRYGQFMRRIPLPSGVKADDAKADFRNGILELHLPKAEESKKRRIKVHTK